MGPQVYFATCILTYNKHGSLTYALLLSKKNEHWTEHGKKYFSMRRIGPKKDKDVTAF